MQQGGQPGFETASMADMLAQAVHVRETAQARSDKLSASLTGLLVDVGFPRAGEVETGFAGTTVEQLMEHLRGGTVRELDPMPIAALARAILRSGLTVTWRQALAEVALRASDEAVIQRRIAAIRCVRRKEASDTAPYGAVYAVEGSFVLAHLTLVALLPGDWASAAWRVQLFHANERGERGDHIKTINVKPGTGVDVVGHIAALPLGVFTQTAHANRARAGDHASSG